MIKKNIALLIPILLVLVFCLGLKQKNRALRYLASDSSQTYIHSEKLEDIYNVLKQSYNYKGEKIHLLNPLSKERMKNFSEHLLSFLSKVKSPKSLENVKKIYLLDSKNTHYKGTFQSSSITININANHYENIDKFSSDFENEDIYQKMLNDFNAEVIPKIKSKMNTKIFSFYDLANKILEELEIKGFEHFHSQPNLVQHNIPNVTIDRSSVLKIQNEKWLNLRISIDNKKKTILRFRFVYNTKYFTTSVKLTSEDSKKEFFNFIFDKNHRVAFGTFTNTYDDMSIKWTVSQRRKSFENIIDNMPHLNETISSHQYDNGFITQNENENRNKNKILIGVIDTGFDYNHPLISNYISRKTKDLRKLNSLLDKLKIKSKQYKTSRPLLYKILEEKISILETNINIQKNYMFDLVDNDNLPYDEIDIHGTHVSGIILGNSIDQENTFLSIVPIRIDSEVDSHLEAFKIAAKKQVRVINYSMGTDTYIEDLYTSICDNQDILIITSAGNTGKDIGISGNENYPSNFDCENLLVVANVRDDNKLHEGIDENSGSSYSQTHVDIAAPGVDIFSSTPKNSYGLATGTSMSSPLVARIAAKILYINPNLTPVQVIEIFKNSTKKIESLKYKLKFGGVVDEEEALRLARETLN